MNSLPKFLPVVLEIIIEDNGGKIFICRNPNGAIIHVMHDISKICSFVDDLCKTLIAPAPSVEK